MTDIEQRALDLLNESRIAFGLSETDIFFRNQTPENEALCRALERQETAMTSELRPAVEVWEADRELAIVALRAWAEQIGSGYSCPAAAQTMLMAATILEADREAVRAEQAAELAKFKALAETLAGELQQIEVDAMEYYNEWRETGCDQKDAIRFAFGLGEETRKALRQYKEATNV